jgi:hypothetical protein
VALSTDKITQLYEWFQKENKGLPNYILLLIQNENEIIQMLYTNLYTWTIDNTILNFSDVIENAINNSHEFEFHESSFNDMITTFDDMLKQLDEQLLIKTYEIKLNTEQFIPTIWTKVDIFHPQALSFLQYIKKSNNSTALSYINTYGENILSDIVQCDENILKETSDIMQIVDAMADMWYLWYLFKIPKLNKHIYLLDNFYSKFGYIWCDINNCYLKSNDNRNNP